MRKAPRSRILVAAIALLFMGSVTGLVSDPHTCSIRFASTVPEILSTQHSGEGHPAGQADTCLACARSAQRQALGLPGVPVVHPPQSVGATGIDEPSRVVGTAVLTRSARAPPLASSDSRAV